MVDYYLAEGGNNGASGSASAPWATPDKVNAKSAAGEFKRGDRVLLQAGKSFPGQIITTGLNDPNGTGQLQIGSYGHGPAPELNGYKVSKAAWTEYRPGVWMLDISAGSTQITGWVTGASTDVGHLRDGSAYRGVKRTTVDGETGPDGKWRPGLLEQWDFTNDSQYIYVRKDTNPGEGIRIAVRHSGLALGNYTSVSGIGVKGFGAHGASVSGRTSVEVTNSIFDSLGGCTLTLGNNSIERFGNGIEAFLNTRNSTFTGNRIRQTFDTAFTVQGDVQTGGGGSRNIIFARNYVENCNQSIEFWARNNAPETTSMAGINVLENVCVDAGLSWAADVRADSFGKGIHLLTYDMQGLTDITVARNVFYGARDAFAWHRGGKPAGMKVYDNSIYLPTGRKITWQDAHTIDNPGISPYVDRSRLFTIPPGDVLSAIAAQTAFASEVSRYWRPSSVAA